MKTTTPACFRLGLPGGQFLVALILTSLTPSAALAASAPLAANGAAYKSQPIPMDQLGTVAGKQYQGDGLSVTATSEGARLCCVFQKLEGQARPEGLELVSTVESQPGDKFHLVACAVGREGALTTLPLRGVVTVADQLARFIRPGLTEEYSVSVDGVRQDFVIVVRPAGTGDLRVELTLSGARAEATAYGAKLMLKGSGRTLAYNRLRATDATGRELTARLEVLSPDRMAVRVDDANATYPVRIDPTFSDENWFSLGGFPGSNGMGWPGMDGQVRAAVTDEEGNLYIAGDFAAVADIFANRIAKWNGSAWSALGSGIDFTNSSGEILSASVAALAVSGTNLYAAGAFTRAGGIAATNVAKWDGHTWSALGSGIGGQMAYVHALAVLNNNLYAGGGFTSAGGFPATNIAKWDGGMWSALGTGIGGSVYALAVSGTNLYAGGGFTTAGGTPVNHIARWNGSAWSALGSGVGLFLEYVYALAVSETNIYAGGLFWKAGALTVNNIAKWNGSGWSALGSGTDNSVRSLAVSGTNLYAGGSFSTAGGTAVNRIAKWNGSAWTAVESGMNNSVAALAASGTNLYAGGRFTTAGGVPANYIARWDANVWTPPGHIGLGATSDNPYFDNPAVIAMAATTNNLYVGGSFSTAARAFVNYVARWDGTNWWGLGLGMNDVVYALAIDGTNLYAGGAFTSADSNPANYIAKWNGTAWTALGSGLNNWVLALVVAGTNLYAGGNFTMAGGAPANYVARWNGSSWSPLGSGMSGDGLTGVYVLAVSGTDLYAGGRFTSAGGVSVNRIAKWDGNSWSALGSGMSGVYQPYVYSLCFDGSTLYAGGNFNTAGGTPANWLARWNGSTWSGLGLRPEYNTSGVHALAVFGSALYVGGGFGGPDGTRGYSFATWDHGTWSDLSSELNGGPQALVVSGTDMYVGSGLTTAGNKISTYVAKLDLAGNVAISGGRLGNLSYSPLSGFSCTFSDATPGQPYRIQTSPSLAVGSWSDFTNFTYTGPIVINDASAPATTNMFYRAVTP